MAYHAVHIDTHTIYGFFHKAGDPVVRHAHDRAHEMGVIRGRLRVRMWPIAGSTVPEERELGAGETLIVPAGWKHEAEALEDGTESYCAFEKFDADGKAYFDPSGSHRLEAEGKPWR